MEETVVGSQQSEIIYKKKKLERQSDNVELIKAYVVGLFLVIANRTTDTDLYRAGNTKSSFANLLFPAN